jgi:hypothetical protein
MKVNGSSWLSQHVTLSEAKHPATSTITEYWFACERERKFVTELDCEVGRSSWVLRFAANDIVCKSLKIKTGSDSGFRRLSPRRRGEDEGEGFTLAGVHGLPCTKTLTLPLSLAKGEATHACHNVIPAAKITPHVL